MKFVISVERSLAIIVTVIMVVRNALVVQSFVHSTMSAIVGYPPRVPPARSFLQRRRSFSESAAIGHALSMQMFYHSRRTSWNLDQKRCSSNSEKADPYMEKEEWLDLKHASIGGNMDPKHKDHMDKELSPFLATPERDPDQDIYLQRHVAEKDGSPLCLRIPTEECMEEIGSFVAMMIMTTPDLDAFAAIPNTGDVMFLKGDLGAGKSVFARGFIRGAVGNWDLDVPSPTYLLSNTYFASEEQNSNQNLE
jgi:Threonylcarbamoyl adenosine biosynthesis protein TsaE